MAIYFKNLGDLEFYNFATYLNAQVTSNALTWGMTAAIASVLDNAYDVYKPYYDAIITKNARTPQQVEDHREQRGIFEDVIEDFANQHIIFNTLISNAVVETLGFNRQQPGSPRPAITAEVFAKMEALAGSKIQFICRTNNDSSRASVLKEADGVEVRYIIGTQPNNVNECTQKEIFSKARFVLELNPANAGQKIYGFVRWRNNSNIEKSGPWTDMLVTVIRS